MLLNYREYGSKEDGKAELILLHGLLGSAINWNAIAKSLVEKYHIIVPDLRNHGSSPHNTDVGYPALASDIKSLMQKLAINNASFIGHSMGGKLAMYLALENPELINDLIIADIAPVTYKHNFSDIFEPMLNLPLNEIKSRKEADEFLSKTISHKGIRDYLLQNLSKTDAGWKWKINVEGLSSGITDIQGFPSTRHEQFEGMVTFIRGELSDYVSADYYDEINHKFPNNQIKEIKGAGHWVYSEKPIDFLDMVGWC